MGETVAHYDCAIVGGGIVGLATALALAKKAPAWKLILLEKESALATHQTGHNSGVIHSGIYYRPGSLKARFCVQGAAALIEFCRQQGIRVEFPGKLIVAAEPKELPALESLYQQGLAHGLQKITLIGPEQIKEFEPHAAGIRAIRVPMAGIIDYTQVALALARILRSQGVPVRTSARLTSIAAGHSSFVLRTSSGEIQAKNIINCGGLFADRISRMAQGPAEAQIFPFRGEYYELVPEKRSLVLGLIYPVPDPRLPFLGVHLSRRTDGRVEAGPNAVLALHREGYKKTDCNLQDLLEMLAFPGLWRLAWRYGRTGLEETARSLSKSLFVRSLQKLVPSVLEEHLLPSKSGIRAQAVNRQGQLLDDFHLIQTHHALHVINAPSPAATASLAIGDYIAEQATRQFDL